MKLNPDCIRDILLDIESVTTVNIGWHYNSHQPSPRMSKYGKFEIAYHARYCAEANLITGFDIGGNSDSVFANDLTPSGHHFLENIRENKIWNGVKSIAGKVGSTSLDALIQISSNVITELIKAQFGITSPAPSSPPTPHIL